MYGAVHKLYNALEGWGWGRGCVISVILGGCGGWIVRYITQGNYKWFMVHNAHFILTPSVVLKTAIITYSPMKALEKKSTANQRYMRFPIDG